MEDLITCLKQDTWMKGDPRKAEDYKPFRIFKFLQPDIPGTGNYTYGMFDEEGDLYRLNLTGADGSRDPLADMANVCLKISDDKKKILAICVDDDCVVMKQ